MEFRRRDPDEAKHLAASRAESQARQLDRANRADARRGRKLPEVRAKHSPPKQKAKNEVQERYHRFLDQRREALYRDTQFTGLLPATNLELTRKAAEGALSVFAERNSQDDWKLGDLPDFLSSEQQAEVREGCYEMLMVLADVAAGQQPAQVDRALRVLDSAARLRPDHPRAYHLKKASLLAAKNDRAGADRELAAAALVPPRTSFDYFLIGQDEYKHRRWTDAISDFEIGLEGEARTTSGPGACRRSASSRPQNFDAANSNLIGCLEAEPDSAWLYLLRGLRRGPAGRQSLEAWQRPVPAASPISKEWRNPSSTRPRRIFNRPWRSLKRTPDNDLLYILFVNRGVVRFQRDQLDEAAADYLAAIRTKKDPNAHANLAFVYDKQGKIDEAIAEFGEAIALEPDSAPLYRGRAELLQDRPDATSADRQAAQADLKLAIRYEDKDNQRPRPRPHQSRQALLSRRASSTTPSRRPSVALRAAPDEPECVRLAVSGSAPVEALRRSDPGLRHGAVEGT